ncbi:hypothetical protein [Parabacteroides sp. FAFU027]|uniref:hypothetical protein n=1 Tax=Parabacteroides sp. FAFU027 TaxID=2922715 RepID=UPI001FB03012|nr:hypothetical protein [Parabacteroides sp. FAFU027]
MKTKIRILAILSTCGLIFTGCSLCATKPKQTTTVENQVISFDSLKSRFEKGDKIIINDWILIGPTDFFDSVSIDKNTLKGTLLPKDTILKRFGCNRAFYELKIKDMDLLPQGNFIDIKAYRFLNPNEEIFYLINGSPCDSYSKTLQRITNKRIKEINKLDSYSATKIWGDNYGKNGALIINTYNEFEAQEIFRPFNSSSISRKITKIDSLEFYSNKVIYSRISQPSTIKKKNKTIKVPIGNSAIEFHDNANIDNPINYIVIGQDKKYEWILIKGEDELQDYYYIVNQNLNKIDTLVGNPMIFGDKLLCQEGSYTDGTDFIELWDTTDGKLKRIKKFSLRTFGIYVDEIYLKGDMIFVRFKTNKYLKLKI